MTSPAVGLQLYTLRSLREPLDALLERVAAIGYEGVETVGMQGVSGGALRAALSRHGLRFVSAHVALRALRAAPSEELEAYATAGAEQVVVPWLDPADRPASQRGWQDLARELDALGAAARAAGMDFGYHHHAFELEEREGATPLDVILEVADPDRVGIELDVGWLVHAGHDPVGWIERVAGRCRAIHAKDIGPPPYGGAPWADVGDGVVEWPAVVAAAEGSGVPWLLVEHDAPTDAWRTAERSLAALRRTIADL